VLEQLCLSFTFKLVRCHGCYFCNALLALS